MATTKTNMEVVNGAIEHISEALSLLDQAHDELKLVNMEDVRTRGMSIKELYLRVCDLFEELKNIECEDCDHLVSKHDDQYGCQHERGDWDGVAQGPCGCDWGQRPAGSGSASANTPR